jgi:hypothetical protein
MAQNTTTAAVLVSLVEDGVQFDVSDEAADRWADQTGLRFEVGMAYVETDQAGRDLLIEQFGAGMVRRSLLVAAKANSEHDQDDILALRDAIVTRVTAAA